MSEKIKIHFLGTASSIPTKRRNHTAMLLGYKDENILFDCGEGTQRQFRKAEVSPNKITRILLSHWHGDHMLGLPGLLQTMVMNGYNKELIIYGPKGSKQKMQELLNFFGIDGNNLKLQVHEVQSGIVFDKSDFKVECAPMDHYGPCNGYSFIIKEKSRIDKAKLKKLKIGNGPHLGELARGKKVKINGKTIDGSKLIYKEEGKKVTFIVDSRFNENAIKLSKDSDLLICESSFSATESDLAKDHGHMTSEDASKIAKKSNSKKLALIHLSQRYDAIPKMILSEAKKTFKEVFVPEDLDWVEV